MKPVAHEHDEKYLKGGMAGFFIGVVVAFVVLLLLLNQHPVVAGFMAFVAFASVITFH